VGVAERTIARSRVIPSHVFRPTYFTFAPIGPSKGRTFRATLTVSAPGVALWGSGESLGAGGAAYVAGLPDSFDFSYATRHAGTYGERLARLSRWAPLWLVLPAAVATLALVLAAAGAAMRLSAGPEELAAPGI
jgi:hypothetical protein